MLRKLLVTGIVFAAGYAVGAIFGFRAAVVDYVENDASKLERMAADIYPSPEEGAQQMPESIGKLVEQVEDEGEGSDAKGFQ